MPDLLPPNATPQERALSLATERQFAVPVRQLWSPYTCPAGQLPWLAWALSVDEWDAAWPETTQRQVIAASIDQHRKKGTVGALRRALQRLGYDVEIDEATGTAYTFRLRVKLGAGDSAGGAVAEAALGQAVQIALRQKNARSELIGTAYVAETDPFTLYAGGASVSGAEYKIESDEFPEPGLLDNFAETAVAAFWTRRMFSAYEGPVARVRRASDSAELDYFTSRELRDFVEGTTFQYLRLYNQNGAFVVAYLEAGSPATGAIDANGYGYIASNGGMRFGANLPPSGYSAYSVVVGAKSFGTSERVLCRIDDGAEISSLIAFHDGADYKVRVEANGGISYAEAIYDDPAEDQFFAGSWSADACRVTAEPLSGSVDGAGRTGTQVLSKIEFPYLGAGGMFGCTIFRNDDAHSAAGQLTDNYGSRLP